MGIFSPVAQRNAYVPPSNASGSPTVLTGGDANLVRTSSGDNLGQSADNVQVAQQRPASSPAAVQATPQFSPLEKQQMLQPGRGYGVIPADRIEQGMNDSQKIANRNGALLEIARQTPSARDIAAPLPDDWRQTKPPEFVHALERAAQRHDVPLEMLARMMFQEGKFGERVALKPNWDQVNKTLPIGLAQMTTQTYNDLVQRAELRRDVDRVKELRGFSPMNPDYAFDAAGEHLAYLYRRLGSWPAAAAAYNDSLGYVQNWLNGEISHKVTDPINRKTLINGRVSDKWQEMMNYVANAMQKTGPSPQTGDLYAGGSSLRYEPGFRVAKAIQPPPYHDTKENP